jgi:Cof subfamily protein (haloacid dehalogenase superfamily)
MVFDVDGTILDGNGKLPEATLDFLHELKYNGVKLALATGRSLNRVQHFAVPIDGNMPLILMNGAWIHDLNSGEDWLTLNLDKEKARKIIPLLRSWSYDIILQKGIPDCHLFFYDKTDSDNIEYNGRIERNYERCSFVPDLINLLTEDPGEITILDKTDRILEAKAKLEAENLDIGIVYSTSFINDGYSWLEILPRDVTKGNAMKFLSRKLNIQCEKIVSVGDNYNDVEMLEYSGIGVAVGSAEPGVKAIADVVLPDNGKGVVNLRELLKF